MAEDTRTDAERYARRQYASVRRSNSPSTEDADANQMVDSAGKRVKVTDEQFLAIFEKAGGFRSRVAKQLGVSVSAVSHRIARSPFLRDRCRDTDERILDLAEAQLVKAAQEGEAWAITFILKCKGRKRGWIERNDMVFGTDMDAPPPPIILGLHDEAFVEAERKKNEEALAEIVDVEFRDVLPGGIFGKTSGAVSQPLTSETGDGADDCPVDGEKQAETRPGVAENAPAGEGGQGEGRDSEGKEERSVASETPAPEQRQTPIPESPPPPPPHPQPQRPQPPQTRKYVPHFVPKRRVGNWNYSL